MLCGWTTIDRTQLRGLTVCATTSRIAVKTQFLVMQHKKSRNAFEFIKNNTYQELRKQIADKESLDYLAKCDDLADLYVSPPGYLAWNDYAKFCLVSGCLNSIEYCFQSGDVRGSIASTTYRSAVMGGTCARYASKAIIESFEQTPVPELPPEILEVFPFVHLMLPRHTVYDMEGDEVLAILLEAGQIYENEYSEEGRAFSSVFFPKARRVPGELLGARGIQIFTLTAQGIDVFQEFVNEGAKSWHSANVKNVKTTKYASPQTEKIIRIAINSLLIHLYEPELVVADSRPLSKGVGFASSKKQPLPPTWIGKTFKRVSEKFANRSVGSPGGCKDIRPHWRRGHWRSQPVGPGRAERRVLWIKPVYVNASTVLQHG